MRLLTAFFLRCWVVRQGRRGSCRCMLTSPLLRCANVGSLLLASNTLRNVAKMSAATFEVDPEYPGTAVDRRPAARALMPHMPLRHPHRLVHRIGCGPAWSAPNLSPPTSSRWSGRTHARGTCGPQVRLLEAWPERSRHLARSFCGPLGCATSQTCRPARATLATPSTTTTIATRLACSATWRTT